MPQCVLLCTRPSENYHTLTIYCCTVNAAAMHLRSVYPQLYVLSQQDTLFFFIYCNSIGYRKFRIKENVFLL